MYNTITYTYIIFCIYIKLYISIYSAKYKVLQKNILLSASSVINFPRNFPCILRKVLVEENDFFFY